MILVACEESQVVTEAFIKRGIDAMSCDLNYPGAKGLPHYRGDVRDLLNEYFDMVIFHPVCTRLANSGVRWLRERNLWGDFENAVEFFNLRHKFNSELVATENPIPHKYATEKIGKYDQIIQPWQFGHGETKATCLWLKGLPRLVPTNIVEGREQRIWKMTPGPERAKQRSRTFPGIAEAMATQWGGLIEKRKSA